jgi:hypothetical protein
MRDAGGHTAFCSKQSSDYKSCYSAFSFFILGMQIAMHELLEIV